MSLHHIDYKDLSINPMTLFAEDWGLLGAGTEQQGYNAMTIAWGHLGAIWSDKLAGKHIHGRPTATCFVRPSRATLGYIDDSEFFSISFLPAERKRALAVMGKFSGRDTDKFAAAELTPLFHAETGVVYPQEANLVFVCRKIYRDRLREDSFLDPSIVETNYPERDFHYVFVGQIVDVLATDEHA